MAEPRTHRLREIGLPSAIFVALLAGPWLIIPSIGLVFAPVVLLVVLPIWWWIVRGRTDEPVRGAWAGLFIGPLVHAGELFVWIVFMRGPPGPGDMAGGIIVL